MKNSEKTSEPRDSTRIRQICAQVLAFFQEQRSLSPQQRVGYCQTLGNGGLQTQRTLGCGIVLTLTSPLPKTATLSIGLEPKTFKQWIKHLGDISLFYTDPFGIEIMLRDGLWGAYIGSYRLPFDLNRNDYHEIGHLEIQNGGAYLVASKENLPLAYCSLRGSDRVCDHRPELLNNSEDNSRILPDPSPTGVADPGSTPATSEGAPSSADRLLRILEGSE